MNILLITSDQQHYNTIGKYNPEISTPNLDKLIEQGAYCDRTYCPNPTCTPTRASLITGLYPSQHGGWTLGTKLPETVETLGDILGENGYDTALIGKAHFQPLASTKEYPSLESYPVLQDLEFWKNFNERFYGFDHVELTRNHTDESHVGQHYALWLEEKGCKDWKKYFCAPTGTRDYSPCRSWDIPEDLHYNAWIAERTNARLEHYAESEKPFFLWASFFDPHPAYVVPEPWFSMYDPDKLTMPEFDKAEFDNMPPHFAMTQEAHPDFSSYRESGFAIHGMQSHLIPEATLRQHKSVYYGMVSLMDKYIGKIIDKVEQLGLDEDTLIIFTTDHGHFIGEHGLRAKGPFMYEDLIRIPFIVKGKDVKKGCSSSLQTLVDFAPTILEAAGIPVPRTMSGISQYPVWTGSRDSVRDSILCEHHHEPSAINVRTYVDSRYKITVYQNQDYGEIFDLEEDPGEQRNLWNNIELRVKLLQSMISAELSREVMWMPRIASA